MNRITKLVSSLGVGVFALAVPFLVQAQDTEVDTFLNNVLGWIDTLILIVMALAFLFFLWGLAKFVLNAGDETARSEGKQTMLWGIIAFVVMVSLWGIVDVLSGSLGVDEGKIDTPPSFSTDDTDDTGDTGE